MNQRELEREYGEFYMKALQKADELCKDYHNLHPENQRKFESTARIQIETMGISSYFERLRMT